MKNNLANKITIVKEFIRFCLVGVSNLLIDILVYWLLTRFLGIYYILAAIVSYAVAMTWSFFINRHWTFKSVSPKIGWQYVRFTVVNIISALINLGLLFVFVEFLGVYDLLAKALISVIVAFLSFSLNRYWTFNVGEK